MKPPSGIVKQWRILLNGALYAICPSFREAQTYVKDMRALEVEGLIEIYELVEVHKATI